MPEPILAEWRSTPNTGIAATIIPDGCRDLIMRLAPGEKPQWFVSSLAGGAYDVAVRAGVFMQGFRLRPGVQIDERRLLASVQNRHVEGEDIRSRINSFTHLSPRVAEALDCLASDVGSVARAARALGVSQKSLQRLLARETGRPPAYWMLLARVRQSARTAFALQPLAETAFIHGYADQAHMSREFKRWLNISPSTLRRSGDMFNQLNEAGYG